MFEGLEILLPSLDGFSEPVKIEFEKVSPDFKEKYCARWVESIAKRDFHNEDVRKKALITLDVLDFIGRKVNISEDKISESFENVYEDSYKTMAKYCNW